MRKTFLAFLAASVVLPAFAVRNGDTLASVLAEKGAPASRVERGDSIVLNYGETVVRLEKGVVVSIQGPGADYAVRTQAPASQAPADQPAASAPAVGQAGDWTTDVASALAGAKGTGRKTFLLFTGTDWCIWCKRLEGEILSKSEFTGYARQHLVLVKLDFPKRLPQSAELKAQNARLAQQYGIEGFPTIVVLDDSGKEVGRLGYVDGGPGPFLQQVRGL